MKSLSGKRQNFYSLCLMIESNTQYELEELMMIYIKNLNDRKKTDEKVVHSKGISSYIEKTANSY
jgi:hypothetical protein